MVFDMVNIYRILSLFIRLFIISLLESQQRVLRFVVELLPPPEHRLGQTIEQFV